MVHGTSASPRSHRRRTSRGRLGRGAVLLVLALGAVACASRSGFDTRDPNNLIRQVEVINDNQSDVVVYAVVGPTRFRLGTATAKLSHTFEIPEAASLDVHDVVIVLQTFPGTNVVELAPIVPSGGESIQVVIAPRIQSSRVQII